jgi:hypothetical protein
MGPVAFEPRCLCAFSSSGGGSRPLPHRPLAMGSGESAAGAPPQFLISGLSSLRLQSTIIRPNGALYI